MPVTARFSNGGGNPAHPDYAPDAARAGGQVLPARRLADRHRRAVSRRGFPTRTPEGFVELIRAQGAGPAAALEAARASSPATRRRCGCCRGSRRRLAPPASYATIPYYAVHAFRWLDADGRLRASSATPSQPAAGSRAAQALGGAQPGPRLPAGRDRASGWPRAGAVLAEAPDRRARAIRPTTRARAWPRRARRVTRRRRCTSPPRHRARDATTTCSCSTPPGSPTGSSLRRPGAALPPRRLLRFGRAPDGRETRR